MGDVFSWFLHQGIVRVLSVPIGMIVLLYLMYVLAAPPPWTDDEDAAPR
ncbi:MAG: hypothetical protein Q7S58_10760 [Candidatus Binatus sp.]|nr:hypothetical protein [Candidatus Binatus sp.]MDO8432875.1 hypothetical protein [Candidatus Binatus sp.]